LFLLLLTLTFSLLPGVLPTQKMTALQNLDQDALAEIVFLDVGQGDCTLVLLPQGTVLLIDGGGKEGSPGSVGENILLPYLKSRAIDHIDIIINSHPHGDHLDGLLSVLEQLPVDTLITAAAAARNSQQLLLLDTAARQGVHILPLSAGDIYPVEQARLQVYWPEKEGDYDQDPNAGSLIFELCYGEIDLLFPGDAEAPQLQQATAAYDVEAEIIKMPHHGSNDGYAEDFYQETQAETIIFTVGMDNRYGHPGQKVIEYWQHKSTVYRTDYQGSITIYTDGNVYHAQSYKN
ncbi:MAG: MBL fold metallo-hydrolase, partial [Clostridiales bacterium]